MKRSDRSHQKKARIGDVIEIMTPGGLGYVQYTHDGGTFGELVRVLPGLYDSRPLEIDKLCREKELYFVFYILNDALRTGKVNVVSNQPVPEEWTHAYPMMRQSAAFDDLGHAIRWRIISAANKLTIQELQNTLLLTRLSPEQTRLSIFEIWPHAAMVRELTRGWTPEHSEELRFNDSAEMEKSKQDQKSTSTEGQMRHFLYFSKELDALRAGERLRSGGFDVDVRGSAGEEKWLILAENALPKTAEQMDEIRDQMESLAVQFGGEYDGWEAPIDSLNAKTAVKSLRVN